jgi:chromate reductase, NAD(P)H dehydrogenase (quinone)
VTRVLLVSGSVRDGSTNTAVLRTVAAIAPPDVDAVLYDGILGLPHFNPDDDAEGAHVPEPVAQMRAALHASGALLICTPEYAGAMPAVLKNLLEWTIGDASTYRKPVGWINASSPAAPTGGADAHESLAKVLRYAHADVVEAACIRLELTRPDIGDDGLVASEGARQAMADALAALVTHALRQSEGDRP